MFIMLGYEGETEADLRETVECLKRAMPDRLLTTLAYPIKGTPYYEEVADRVVALRSWSDGSYRDLSVAGRRSRRYFVHANRWVVNTWALHRERQRGASNPVHLARHFVASQAGRIGMLLTGHEREPGRVHA